MPRRAALLALLAALLIAPAAAHADTFTVNATGDHAADSCDGAAHDAVGPEDLFGAVFQ